jgi:O-antigen/teichoic acid export membrane protein
MAGHWPAQPGRHMMEGSLRNLLAEALFPLTALVTAAFLTRRLGTDGYGLLVLTVTIIAWLQWSLNAVFARATIKHVSQSADWRPVGTAAVNLQLFVGSGAMLLTWGLAVPLSRLLNEPNLAWYLGLMAIDIPLSCVVQAHRHILTGLGTFGHCAVLSAGRWTIRLGLIVVFVSLGWSVTGAIVGMIGASVGELLLARRAIRPALFRRISWTEWPLWDYAMPLFLSSSSATLFLRLDLLSLKALGGSAVDAGVYGAAQNLSLLPGVLGLVVAPILLSTVSRVLSRGEAEDAGELARNALRGGLLLFPLAALVCGAAEPLVLLVFGEPFAAAVPIMRVLMGAAFVMLLTTISLTLLTAYGKPRLLLLVTGPLVPLALAGHLLAVPQWGPLGAAAVTGLLACLAAAAAISLATRVCRLAFPGTTLLRAMVTTGLVLGFAVLWPVSGLWIVPKLAIGGLLTVTLYWALGEFSVGEVALARSLLRAKMKAP